VANGLCGEVIHLYQGDIVNYKSIKGAIDDFGPDFVVNFAAKTHVDRSIHEADSFVYTNTIGVENILKAISGSDIRLIQMSTDEVYGDTELESFYEFNEKDALHTSSPYSASKAAADMLTMAYHRTYGVDVVTVRPTNNYGPYQYPEKLIPFIIKRMAEGKTIPIYGTGANIREWLYVEDCCSAIETVMRYGASGEVYNVGPGHDNRVSNVFIAGQLDGTNEKFEYITDRPGHDMRYAVDSKKIRDLGWKPLVDIKKGLKLTKAWYNKRLDLIRKLEANAHIK
jgi:dTDP-glucose 4,6-dehydratase